MATMSLAEKLAAKKAAEAATKEQVTEAKVIPIAVVAEAVKAAPASILNKNNEDPKDVSDLSQRIEALKDLAGEDLAGAMKDLQTALIQNPSAVALMLPEDIGEMVIALRRLTGLAIAMASEKKTKSGAKKKNLTEEEMNAAFDEL